jgi:hypothetical protein
VIAAALLLALMTQDTVPTLPARARAMLATFPEPREGEVLVTTRFSKESAWLGEQVELLTAAWFPEDLRARLRRSPTLTAPSLSGLWSVQSQVLPVLAGTRRVGRLTYAVYVQYQTLFPLGSGKVEAPPAVLSYSVPTSSSFFAPEDRKSVASRPAVLMVKPIPPGLLSAVGSGPTASNIRVVWLGPVSPMRVGVPTMLELLVSGTGNIALWPAPEVEWPGGLRVYPERTAENPRPGGGLLTGEKHFRFTVVADSAGIYSLPRVRYPYFDPAAEAALTAEASAFPLPVLPAVGGAVRPEAPVVTGVPGVPLATLVVGRGWPLLLLLFLLPLILLAWQHRRRQPQRVIVVERDPEHELRRLLNEPADSGPERVASALRHRGVPRTDAEQLHRWLVAVARRRYGPLSGDAPAPPAIIGDVLRRLRRSGTAFLLLALAISSLKAQQSDAATRYQAGDYAGAAERFAAAVAAEPDAEDAWRDLGSSRWMNGDDAGAATAWLHAFTLAPRDPFLREVWRRDTAIPAEVRDLAPLLPVSRDELWLIALVVWLLAWAVRATRHRRWSLLLGACSLLMAGAAGTRWYQESRPRALLRTGVTYRVSPIPTAPELGSAPGWTLIDVAARRGGWVLAVLPGGRRGWIPESGIAPLAPLD